MTIVEEEHLYN